jgi:Mg2+ and Co2+ transporter CorA
MQFNAYEITQDRGLLEVEADSISADWLTDRAHRWIDLTEFERHDLEALLAPLHLHPEIANACLDPQSRPRVIILERFLFVSIPVQTDEKVLSYLTLLCGETTLITIAHSDIAFMDNFASYYRGDRRLIAANSAALVFELLDSSLRLVSSAGFALRDEVVAISYALEDDGQALDIDRVMEVARRAAQIEMLFQDQQFCLSELLNGRSDSLELDTFHAAASGLVADLDRVQVAVGRLQDRAVDAGLLLHGVLH